MIKLAIKIIQPIGFHIFQKNLLPYTNYSGIS